MYKGISIGLVFVFTTQFFPFHSDVIGTKWEDVDANYHVSQVTKASPPWGLMWSLMLSLFLAAILSIANFRKFEQTNEKI